MEHYRLYDKEIPAFVRECIATPCMQRLAAVGMNCGCEYTAFPRFAGLKPYSRLDHSIGVAMIVRRFANDEKQALAGLLHDVASPVFAHVVDFLHGDYLVQESTEDGTRAIIASDPALMRILTAHGLTVDDVSDYHRYPVADNDSPKLSADRLEYTLGNCLNYGIRTEDEVRAIFADLCVAENETGEPEIAFSTEWIAADFTAASLACSKIYVSDEDRGAMQMLSEILRDALRRGVIAESDLHTTEPAVIAKFLREPETAAAWKTFCAYRAMRRSEKQEGGGQWRKVFAKKRYIDPLIKDRGRVSACVPDVSKAIEEFLSESQDVWICAE